MRRYIGVKTIPVVGDFGDIFLPPDIPDDDFVPDNSDGWAPYSGPGHWPDGDMMVIGNVGWGRKYHYTNLTPDEQYTHVTLWAMQASPLLIGCDMAVADKFTKSLKGRRAELERL